ncbi:MAG: UDP-N-acetylmuramoyl-L-alanine--D-glutamate ligase [Pseudomonadota bacterium]
MTAPPSSLHLQGRRVLVVGLARSGRAAAALCRDEGARVTCTDLRPGIEAVPGCRMVLGAHPREEFLEADLVVLSPGVPATQPDLQAAVAAGVPVVGELALAAERLCAPILAVSGTNGKSTVTHFTGQLLSGAGSRAFVGGNIGRPLSEAVALGPWDHVVAEVSSYQLEWPGRLTPAAACILNLTPDHLGRHGTMEVYGATKCRLFDRMGPAAAALLPWGDALLARLAEGRGGARRWIGERPGVWIEGADCLWDAGDGAPRRVSLAGFRVPGAHNRWNAAVALALALAVGVPAEALDPATLSALAHRMEVVAERDGVTWINDSKATNVAAALTGLAGLGRPAIALLGGDGKDGEDYGLLAGALGDSPAVICFGRSGDTIAAALSSLRPHRVGTMAEAVAVARRLAGPGAAVVLSPACASFDEFQNFEHRGDVFRALALESA